MRIAALIVAAGRGTRAGGDRPKQWQTLRGKPVLSHAMAAFTPHVALRAVVLHPDDHDLWDNSQLSADLVIVGGATRDASVRAGLEALAGQDVDLVLIHDAARPLVSDRVITDVIVALAHHAGAAPALAVTDALWTGDDNVVSGTRDREGLFRAQTPQGFHFDQILAAHRTGTGPFADDVAAARAAGLDVAIVPGAEENFKITGPDDLARAEQQMGAQMDIRLGNGYDVHRFGPGDHVWLCGVKVSHDRGLQGHSDADVGMHAVTDAIYGALGMGDIGQHFPPSDPQWKGAASHIFLEHAVALAARHGFRISNVDCTLICEYPKIGPHQPAMKAALSQIMDLPADRISVKATTSERLGFTGRGEGIASIATATLVST
ncbi:bifunctional 2-C-methyl-D-erythritol 4-phosphate cytidylyltransferase/2-C-methyl-D-erythritol 2,4-cyclodiphosphate synthase [Yoonia sp. R2331]|uniref:bifunctional 2-C-methyl-D-erythritol 4-phosphate cytidylyltransferase/2-C-methyl-D-erythritol 2,4-cyclodiphosphate synthase n=1 Tax=Yoonia sp. R2331 TaxID=3237238 RepID=UPI0034E3DA7F